MKLLLLLIVFAFQIAAYAQVKNRARSGNGTTLVKNCSKAGYQCGSCEDDLHAGYNKILSEITGGAVPADRHFAVARKVPGDGADIKAEVTVSDFFAKLVKLLKDTNVRGGNKLNWLLVQNPVDVEYPRLVLKSPEGELWAEFVTNPKAIDFGAPEILEFNGKDANVIFNSPDFVEDVRHVNLAGKQCMGCHQSPNPRPIWETYRSWKTIPPRDDYLETNPAPQDQRGFAVPDASRKLDGAAEIWFKFAEKIVEAKEKQAKRGEKLSELEKNLALLDIPWVDPEDDSADADIAKIYDAGAALAPRQQLEKIRATVLAKGFYRIPHFPVPTKTLNYSEKTAKRAGSSHLGFDQMQAFALCNGTQKLANGRFGETVRWALSGWLFCESTGSANVLPPDFKILEEYLPPFFVKHALDYFKLKSLVGPDGKKLDVGLTAQSLYEAIHQDTLGQQKRANQAKMTRQQEFWTDALTANKIMSGRQAALEARDIAFDKKSGVMYPWSAITDPGGVSGVPEFHAPEIAFFRMVLEPLGVQTGAWSTEIGAAGEGSTTFSFSDQFRDILIDQRYYQLTFNEIFKSLAPEESTENDEDYHVAPADLKRDGGAACTEAKRRSLDAFFRVKNVIEGSQQYQAPRSPRIGKLDCSLIEAKTEGKVTPSSDLVAPAAAMLDSCVQCHSPKNPRAENVEFPVDWRDDPGRKHDFSAVRDFLIKPNRREVRNEQGVIETQLTRNLAMLSNGHHLMGSGPQELLSAFLQAIVKHPTGRGMRNLTCEQINMMRQE